MKAKIYDKETCQRIAVAVRGYNDLDELRRSGYWYLPDYIFGRELQVEDKREYTVFLLDDDGFAWCVPYCFIERIL